MIYRNGSETWIKCDQCTFTEFIGFDALRPDAESMRNRGWIVGRRCICPECARDGAQGGYERFQPGHR